MIEVAEAISGFLPNAQIAPVSNSEEPIYVLSATQLQAIISAAVTKATKSILSQVTLEADITALKAEIVELRAFGEAEIERVCIDIAQDRRRIAALQKSNEISPTKKTADHLDELARLMSEDKTSQISIAKAARLLRLSKERMRQLKPLISRDSRFELTWDRLHGQPKRVVIRLRQYIRANDRHTKFAIGTAD